MGSQAHLRFLEMRGLSGLQVWFCGDDNVCLIFLYIMAPIFWCGPDLWYTNYRRFGERRRAVAIWCGEAAGLNHCPAEHSLSSKSCKEVKVPKEYLFCGGMRDSCDSRRYNWFGSEISNNFFKKYQAFLITWTKSRNSGNHAVFVKFGKLICSRQFLLQELHFGIIC
jgi:hypothetical protein